MRIQACGGYGSITVAADDTDEAPLVTISAPASDMTDGSGEPSPDAFLAARVDNTEVAFVGYAQRDGVPDAGVLILTDRAGGTVAELPAA